MKSVADLRKDFPVFKRKINDKPIIYLDSAATSQKPQYVIDAVVEFYIHYCANIHRGVYAMSEQATEQYDKSREVVGEFLNTHSTDIIFTQGCTEGINFIATAWGNKNVTKDHEIVVSELEHHSNLVPWQQLCARTGAKLNIIPVDRTTGKLELEQLGDLITKKTQMVSITQSSNAIGTQVDLKPIIDRAHEVGSLVLVDAAQSAPQGRVDVKKLDCDICVLSGHKMLAPTGIGALYVNDIAQDSLPPYQFGGGMISEVLSREAFWREAPGKYEAGTPPIAQAIGLKAAIEYMNQNCDWSVLHEHQAKLCARMIDGLEQIEGTRILGPLDQLKKEGHLVSFVIDGIHPHDIASFFAEDGICVRAGTHCAQPLFRTLGLTGSVRASFYFYNTLEEVDVTLEVLEKTVRFLKRK